MRFVIFVALVVVSIPVLWEVFLDLGDPARFWLAAAGLGVVFWLNRKQVPTSKIKESMPPRLEELERRQSAISALKWPSGDPGRPAI